MTKQEITELKKTYTLRLDQKKLVCLSKNGGKVFLIPNKELDQVRKWIKE